VVLGRPHHLAHPLARADVAGIDAQAGGAGLGGLDGASVVSVLVIDWTLIGAEPPTTTAPTRTWRLFRRVMSR
jgi:hypothetical protein